MESEELVDSDPLDIFDTGKWLPNCNKLSCDICDQKFSNKLKIVLHWCTAHGYKLCYFCTNYAFKYDSDKIQHERQHIPFGCSNCNHEFMTINENNVKEHYKEAHQSFLCTFCSSVIQPVSKYQEHVEKKHSVIDYVEFSQKNKLFELIGEGETNRDSFFKCLMCHKRKPMDLFFGHYVFYHNLSIHSLKKSLDEVPEMIISGSLLSEKEENVASTEVEEAGSSIKDQMCTVCENPFEFDEIAKELHSVFCQGFKVCNLKDCSQIFENKNELSQHLDSDHSSLSCKYGCKETTLLNPQDIDKHIESQHDIIECFLCNIVNSSGNFKNHLRDKHQVNLSTYEKSMREEAASKLYRVQTLGNSKKKVLCNFCEHDLTEDIKKFSFITHYRSNHSILDLEILRNLDRNPIIDVILRDRKVKMDKEYLSNFNIIRSLDRLTEMDFDTSKVWCIGVEHIEKKPILDENSEIPERSCEFCNKKFVDICAYYEHLKDDHGFKLVNINSCDKCKVQNAETSINEDNKSFNLALICPQDSSYHVTKDNFKDHLIYDHYERNINPDSMLYKCYVCSFAYKNLKEVRSHFRMVHPDINMMYCKLCRYKLPSNENTEHFLNNHAEDVKRVEKLCCKLCNKEFKKVGTAIQHFANSHRKQATRKKSCFKCQFEKCNKFFDSKEDRKMHQIFAHPDEKFFACKSCPLKFATKSSLSSHNIIHRNVINTCEFCQKTFQRRDSFKEHLLIHSDFRLKCSFCEKVFVQRSNLVRHERIHLNEKPYLCSYCKKAFSDKGACTSHEKVHTREESSNCEVCGKHFARKQKLKYHMRLHTGENVLTCECGKIFPENYSFRKHQESHQNKKRTYKCKFCTKVFQTMKARKTHEQSHEKQETSDVDESEGNVVCDLCGTNGLTPQSMKNHIVEVHGIAIEDWQGNIGAENASMDASNEFILP